MSSESRDGRALVGLLPAAGGGSRLAGHIRGSKESQQIHHLEGSGDGRARSAIGWAVQSLAACGAERAVLIVRDGKWDVVEQAELEWAAGTRRARPQLESLVLAAPTPSSAHTLAAALSDPEFSGEDGSDVALLYPDILLSPIDALARLRALLRPKDREQAAAEEHGPDVILGCFPTVDPSRTDMVEYSSDHQLERMVIKQRRAEGRDGRPLRFTWQTALWRPSFSRWFVAQLESAERERLDAVATGEGSMAADPELHIGRLIERAAAAGLAVHCECFAQGQTLDIGTPESLSRVTAAR